MFQRILLPLDGSEISETAIPYTEELASKLGSEIVLYHVHGHEHAEQAHMHQVYLDRLAEIVQRNIRKDRPNGKEIKILTKVEAGEPTENICNLINNNKIDLIIMTAVSTSGLKIGKMLGSVTDHICQTVPIPIMLIRPQSLKQSDKNRQLINHILLPLDGSEPSKLALPIGGELTAKLKVSATLFRMATMIRIYDNGMGSGAYFNYAKFDEEEKTRVSAEMVVLEKQLKEKGIDATNIVTSGFDAALEIIEVCKKIGIDLVVMSTHGRSGLGRWVFGSVAERVLRYGQTPLLLVHARAV